MPPSDPDRDESVRAVETAAALHGFKQCSDELCCTEVDLIVRRLDDPCESVEQAAGMALRSFGPLSADSIAQKLKAEDPHERRLLVTALGFVGPPHALPYSNMLVALLDSKNEASSQVRVAAAEALSKCGPETGKAAAAALADFLSRAPEGAEGQREQEIAAGKQALVSLREVAVQTLPALLRHKHPDVKCAALDILESLGDGSEVGREIAACTSDASDVVRERAVQALLLLKDPTMPNQVLPKLLDDPNVDVSKLALSIIGKMGPDASAQAVAVSKQLKSEHMEQRRTAAWALGQLGAMPNSVLKAIVAQLKIEKIDEIRALLLTAMGSQGPLSKRQDYILLLFI